MSTAVSNYPPIHHYIIQKASVSQLIKKVYETQLKSYLRYAIFQWCNYIISQHITVDIILFLQHSHLKNIWFLSYCWSSNHHNWSTNRHMRTPTNVFGTSTGTNWLFYRHIIGCPTFVTGIASPLCTCHFRQLLSITNKINSTICTIEISLFFISKMKSSTFSHTLLRWRRRTRRTNMNRWSHLLSHLLSSTLQITSNRLQLLLHLLNQIFSWRNRKETSWGLCSGLSSFLYIYIYIYILLYILSHGMMLTLIYIIIT